MSLDSDLLRIALALQMGYIKREQLIEVATLRIRGGSALLTDLLQERGYLKPGIRAFLDGMVQAKIEETGSDPRRILSDFPFDPDLRRLLGDLAPDAFPPRKAGEPGAIDREAPGARISDESPQGTRIGPDGETSREERPSATFTSEAPHGGDRYRLGPVIGRGGLGRVIAATDTVLGREVAIKELLPSMTSVCWRTETSDPTAS
ncbi:MAG: hypothetical protein ACYTHM_06105 [Planctomycetota bacterium]|jgi:hypothetical protein